MKTAVIGSALLVALIVAFGTPAPLVAAATDQYWDSPGGVLPMTFAHADHVQQNCLVCHHNYVDDTGDGACMFCHVADERVANLLERQFHDLCMGCHIDEQSKGGEHGPTRRCVACHLPEELP